MTCPGMHGVCSCIFTRISDTCHNGRHKDSRMAQGVSRGLAGLACGLFWLVRRSPFSCNCHPLEIELKYIHHNHVTSGEHDFFREKERLNNPKRTLCSQMSPRKLPWIWVFTWLFTAMTLGWHGQVGEDSDDIRISGDHEVPKSIKSIKTSWCHHQGTCLLAC